MENKQKVERKRIKEELEILLSKGNLQEKLCLKLIEKGLKGDVRAFEIIRNSIGEKDINNCDLKNSPTIIDDINPFRGLTTEELRELIEEERHNKEVKNGE